MTRETVQQLAQAVYDGDLSAWNPLLDALIELGYPRIAEYHKCCPDCLSSLQDCDAVIRSVNDFWEDMDRMEKRGGYLGHSR